MNGSGLPARILERIKSSDLWTSRSREGGRHISGLKCPECGKNEASIYTESPWVVLCSRKDKCGAKTKTLDIFPELKTNVEKEFAPTRDDPDRPAREYLYSRGLTSKSLKGLKFRYVRNIRNCGSGGVMFEVGTNDAGQTVSNGRIFSPPDGEGKTHNQGSTRGMFWRHPGLDYDPGAQTCVVEGIIDALSLIEMGHQAIAVLSAKQDPGPVKFGDLAGEAGARLLFAFDEDNAGADGIRKWKAAYPRAVAIVPLRGDWNDLLRDSPAGKAKEIFETNRMEMQARADILIAETAVDYAERWAAFYVSPPGLFEFEKCYWWAQPAKRNDDGRLCNVMCVSNFTVETDHYQLDTSDPVNSHYRYFLKVFPARGKSVCCSVGGSDLADHRHLRSALLSYAKVDWRGEAGPSKTLVSRIVDAGAPEVRKVHVLGHDRETAALVFRDFLIDKEGKLHDPDGKGFFRVSRKEFLRAPNSPDIKCVRPEKGIPPKRIVELINAAWPHNGALAVAFALASWFVWDVKPRLGFFPFLSLHGDTQTGKSHLMRRINAMQALDDEGLPMTKLNTGKGEIRKLAQLSGLVKGLLEGNKEEKLRFDLESLLTLYNYGNPLQVRAVKSNDIATKETEFLATLVFVQNREPFKSKAQMERIVSSWPFRADKINAATTEAFRELSKIPLREMAWCYIEAMTHRKMIEQNWYAEYQRARDEIMEKVPDNRIAENHGLLLGFSRLAEKIFGARLDLGDFVELLARKKHQSCNRRDATYADHFFDAINDLEGGRPEDEEEDRELSALFPRDKSSVVDTFLLRKGDFLYIRLSWAIKKLGDNGFPFYPQQLQKELLEHPAFVRSNFVIRHTWGREKSITAKTWVFNERKLEEDCQVTR